jgi:hypothetical protein
MKKDFWRKNLAGGIARPHDPLPLPRRGFAKEIFFRLGTCRNHLDTYP